MFRRRETPFRTLTEAVSQLSQRATGLAERFNVPAAKKVPERPVMSVDQGCLRVSRPPPRLRRCRFRRPLFVGRGAVLEEAHEESDDCAGSRARKRVDHHALGLRGDRLNEASWMPHDSRPVVRPGRHWVMLSIPAPGRRLGRARRENPLRSAGPWAPAIVARAAAIPAPPICGKGARSNGQARGSLPVDQRRAAATRSAGGLLR